MAMCLEAVAVFCIVADGGRRPLVVQRPDDALATSEDSLKVLERQETLIHPMQVDNIGLSESLRLGDVLSAVRNIDLPQITLTQPISKEYACPFPVKRPRANFEF